MPDSPQPDPLFRSAAREAVVVAGVWLGALVYTIGVCGWLGYEQCPSCAIPMVLGFPRWVFWGIVVPWAVCVAITTWFAFFFMSDDSLGSDEDDEFDEPLPGAPPPHRAPGGPAHE